MRPTQTLIALTTAIITLAALTTTASTRNLSISTTAFRTTWTAAEFTGGFGTTRCPLTIEGSLRERTITKTHGAGAGTVTSATLGACQTGSATILRETLPWRTQYASFTGTLPNIGSIITNVIGVAFQIREPVFGITCLATSTAANPATGGSELTSGAVTRVTLGGSVPTNCGTNGTLSGTSSTNSAQTITLI